MNTGHQPAMPPAPPQLPPVAERLALPAPQQTFDAAYAPFEPLVRNAFFFKYGWLECGLWEDYYQEGVIKLWRLWQQDPDFFETHGKRFIVKTALNCGHAPRADQRRDKHVAFSLNDTPEDILDDNNASVEFVLYMNTQTNPYQQVDLRIDFEASFGKTIAEIQSLPSCDMLTFMLLRVMLGMDIHEIKDTLGVKRKQASNWRYEAMKRLKKHCTFLQ